MRLIHIWLFPALWGVWLVFWSIAAFGAKPVRRRESVASRLSHFIPLGIGILLLSDPYFTASILPGRFLPRTAMAFWIGAAIMVTGMLFCVSARLYLGGNWSGSVTLKQDHTLTREGPYRYVRHPIYFGILLAVLGNAIAMGEWRALVALALFAGAFLRKIQLEERFMLEQFGDAYARYRREVTSLIPGLV